MNDNRTLQVPDIVAQTLRIAKSSPVILIAYASLMIALSVLIELRYAESAVFGADNLLNLLDILLFYGVLRTLLLKSGLAPNGIVGGFWTYIGVSILTAIAVAIGLLLLIIPGLILWVRWSPAYGFALADGRGVTDALGAAWDSTKGEWLPLTLVMLLPVAMTVAGVTLYFLGSDEAEMVELPISLGANLLFYISSAASLCIGLAAYALLRDRTQELAELFE